MPWERLENLGELARGYMQNSETIIALSQHDDQSNHDKGIEQLYHLGDYTLASSPFIVLLVGINNRLPRYLQKPPSDARATILYPVIKMHHHPSGSSENKLNDRFKKEIIEIHNIVISRYAREVKQNLPAGLFVARGGRGSRDYFECMSCGRIICTYGCIPNQNFCEWCAMAIECIVSEKTYMKSHGHRAVLAPSTK